MDQHCLNLPGFLLDIPNIPNIFNILNILQSTNKIYLECISDPSDVGECQEKRY